MHAGPIDLEPGKSVLLDAHICSNNPPSNLVVFGNGRFNGNKGKLELRVDGKYRVEFEIRYRGGAQGFGYDLSVG